MINFPLAPARCAAATIEIRRCGLLARGAFFGRRWASTTLALGSGFWVRGYDVMVCASPLARQHRGKYRDRERLLHVAFVPHSREKDGLIVGRQAVKVGVIGCGNISGVYLQQA